MLGRAGRLRLPPGGRPSPPRRPAGAAPLAPALVPLLRCSARPRRAARSSELSVPLPAALPRATSRCLRGRTGSWCPCRLREAAPCAGAPLRGRSAARRSWGSIVQSAKLVEIEAWVQIDIGFVVKVVILGRTRGPAGIP